MPITESFHLESRLTAYLNALVYDKTRPFSRLHPDHPILKELALRNEFYAKILICVLAGQEPRLGSFQLLHLHTDSDTLYQNGLYLYEKWKATGIDRAVFNYCQLMNRVLGRAAFTSDDIADGRFPDLCRYELEIRRFIRGMNKEKHRPQAEKLPKRKKFKNLALNA